MLAIDPSAISNDLANVVCRVESDGDLGADFCDRLTRSLAQLFGIAAAACSEGDRASFDRILIRVAPAAPIDARLFLADRLADATEPPRGILIALANDDVAVARPILLRSPALAEDDLVEIARARGPGHMGAIAERPDLTYRITDVLVLRGDDEVRRVVAGNVGAPISDKSFARLSLQAKGDTLIEARLVRRPDLPDVVIRFLVENGTSSAREALAGREPDRPRRDLTCGTVPIRAAEDGWLDPYDFDAAAVVVPRIPPTRGQLDAFVRRLAQADQFAEVVHVLAHSTSLRLDTMKHLLVSLDTEPFAVIARALSLRNETVLELLATGPWLHRLDGRNREAAVAFYRNIAPDTATERLRHWVEQEHRA